MKATAAVDLSLENRVELRRLCNLLGRAGGFALAFGSVAHRRLRERLVAAIRSELPETEIVEVALEPTASVVAQLEAAAGRAPGAMFVYGLETLLDPTRPQSDALAMLNLNRGYCIGRFPWPVVFWGPRFVLREFARQAIDTWSGRSGFYHFEGAEEGARATLAAWGYGWSIHLRDPRESKEALLQVLAELEPTGASKDLAEALFLLARVAEFEGDRSAQAQYVERVRSLYREMGDRLGEAERLGEADCLQKLGDEALGRVSYQDAGVHYREAEARYLAALSLYREMGNRFREADCMQKLGDMVRFGRVAEARYQVALSLYREMGNRLGEADCIRKLADVWTF